MSLFPKRGFTLVEILICVILIAQVAAILMPAFSRRTHGHGRPMQNNTQIRGIHQSLVMYSQSNNGWYPGFDKTGKLIDATVEHRYQILLEGNFFTGEYMISPSETKTEWTTGQVTSAHYSFAMLDLNAPGERAQEWRETLNTEAAIMSDRNTGSDTGLHLSSVHTDQDGGDWRGSIAWNDSHMAFTTTHQVETLYGAGARNTADHLFEDAGGDDAMMIFSGD